MRCIRVHRARRAWPYAAVLFAAAIFLAPLSGIDLHLHL
jgi:hypothetical protein